MKENRLVAAAFTIVCVLIFLTLAFAPLRRTSSAAELAAIAELRAKVAVLSDRAPSPEEWEKINNRVANLTTLVMNAANERENAISDLESRMMGLQIELRLLKVRMGGD